MKNGSGDYVEAELIRDLRGMARQKNGKETPITLTNVKYVPQLFCNLINLTSVLNKGFKLNGKQDGMAIRKVNTECMFDQRINNGDGELVGIQIEVWDAEMAGICRRYTHAILGHPYTHVTNMTAKYLDLNTMHHKDIYKSCIKGRQRQKTSQKRENSELNNPEIKSPLI